LLPSTVTWKIPAGRDAVFEFRVRRSMLLAVAFSLLLHLVALFFLEPQLMHPDAPSAQATPITVRLNLPDKPKALLPPPLPSAEPRPEPKPGAKPAPKTARKSPQPEVLATKKPTPNTVEAPASRPVEPTPSPQPVKPGAPTDMMSYVNAARERNRLAEMDAERANAEAAARERKPGEDEVRNEIIKRNMQSGTNGIFQIVNMNARSAQFTFKGWINDYSTARRELIQVEAAPGEDIKRVVVRKMIELIRRYYSGDFNWESQRLGRVVVLSARKEDSDGLEDFLIIEFFGR
jgi:hypothetical protein